MVFGKWRRLEHMEWKFVSKRLFSWFSLPSLLWQPGRCSALKQAHPLRDCQCLEIRLLRGRRGLNITYSPSGVGRAPRAAPRGEHQRCSWRDLPPPPLTGIGSFPLGKGDLRDPPVSLYPLRSSVRLQIFLLPLKKCFSAAPRTEVLQELPRDPKHPCKRRAGRQPCSPAGQGATAAGAPAPALSRPPRRLRAGPCESPGREEESFVSAPGRRHVPAHCINIYSPHSYLLFDISHGPRPPRPPLGH